MLCLIAIHLGTRIVRLLCPFNFFCFLFLMCYYELIGWDFNCILFETPVYIALYQNSVRGILFAFRLSVLVSQLQQGGCVTPAVTFMLNSVRSAVAATHWPHFNLKHAHVYI